MVNNRPKDLNDILNNKESKKPGSNKQSDNNDIEKSLGGRIPKEVKYVKERKELLNKLLKILDITETNKVFYIDDLEKDETKKKEILDLVDDVKQYFSCGRWVYFAKKNISMPHTSLSKSILKDMKIKVTTVALKDNETNKTEKQGLKIHI